MGKIIYCPDKVRETGRCPRCNSKLVWSGNYRDCLSCNWTCKDHDKEPIEQKEYLDSLQKNIGDDEEYFGY